MMAELKIQLQKESNNMINYQSIRDFKLKIIYD